MELLQLKYFSHAAKSENFSHTAQKFLVPTSCISASIKKLENELGVKLFDRTANRIKLNAYGKIWLKAVDASESILKKAKADILDFSKTPSGELKILVLANRQKVSEDISAFKNQYPQIAFTIKHQFTADRSDMHEYDLIISDRQHIPASQFEQKFWLHEEIFLAVHKDNPLANKKEISITELENEKFISMHKGSSLRHCIDTFFEQKNLNLNSIIECDDPAYIRRYLHMGLGVTFFPSISWKDAISDDIRLLTIREGLYRDSYIYINKSASHTAHLFSQMLETE